MIIILTYFHPRIGTDIFCTFPKTQVDSEISDRLYDVMSQQNEEEFFTRTFGNLKLLNYFFQIRSDWARRNREILMFSIMITQQISPDIEESIATLCKKFVERMRSNEDIFTGFHIKELSKYDEVDQARIMKNELLIKEMVKDLYWETWVETGMKSKEEKINILLNDEPIFDYSQETKRFFDMIHSDPNIIAAVVMKDTQIIYKKGMWDSEDIDRLLLSWHSQNAQFITVSGIRYSILQMEAERLVAMSYKGDESIVAAKDGEYTIICIYKNKNKNGNLPFPYIFNPPSPPRDLGLTAEPLAKRPATEVDTKTEFYCKHCGAELPKGQTICHVCGKKVI